VLADTFGTENLKVRLRKARSSRRDYFWPHEEGVSRTYGIAMLYASRMGPLYTRTIRRDRPTTVHVFRLLAINNGRLY